MEREGRTKRGERRGGEKTEEQQGRQQSSEGDSEQHTVGGVVSDHPREDGILIQIVISAASKSIECHQILKVRDLSLYPSSRKLRLCYQLLCRECEQYCIL